VAVPSGRRPAAVGWADAGGCDQLDLELELVARLMRVTESHPFQAEQLTRDRRCRGDQRVPCPFCTSTTVQRIRVRCQTGLVVAPNPRLQNERIKAAPSRAGQVADASVHLIQQRPVAVGDNGLALVPLQTTAHIGGRHAVVQAEKPILADNTSGGPCCLS
jgi:hypothetical protein